MSLFTYRELRDFLNTLTEEELDLSVTAYLSDIDEALPMTGFNRNTDEEMGEELDSVDSNHPLLTM